MVLYGVLEQPCDHFCITFDAHTFLGIWRNGRIGVSSQNFSLAIIICTSLLLTHFANLSKV